MTDRTRETAMPRPRSFLYQEGDGIARMTLNRPDRLNALTFDVYRELAEAFRAVGGRPGVRSVILSGAGRGFCSGGDHEAIIKPLLDRSPEEHLEFTRLTCDLILAIRQTPRPVVAALHGAVVGAGAVIASACDIRVASQDAKLGFVFVRVGLSGADMGAAWLLPRLVGLGRATRWLMTGEIVEALDALQAGFHTEVVPPGELAARAESWARRLAAGPRASLAVTKHQLNREQFLGLREALDEEARVQAALMAEDDFREGYAAFTGKRRPEFGK